MKLFLPDLFLGSQGSGFWLLVLQRVCLNLLFKKRKFKGFLKGFYDSPLPDNSFWNFFCLLHLFLFFISVSCNAERVQFWFRFWFWICFLGVFIQSLGFFLSFFLSDDDDGRIIKSSWVFSFYPPFAVFINVFVLLMLSSSFCHKYNMPTLVGGHSVYWDIPHFLFYFQFLL